ncbi:hypothetical protein FGO68_gene9796 [Halteria grandinella]|uniref:Uncharacterized protein n=1 Tax=Halteria grandinella TaxID=5974 RepID=A0A8J8NWD3_HALGN|nr:hypothetical protein FGO68_gene9796 [Halteria grandinella]
MGALLSKQQKEETHQQHDAMQKSRTLRSMPNKARSLDSDGMYDGSNNLSSKSRRAFMMSMNPLVVMRKTIMEETQSYLAQSISQINGKRKQILESMKSLQLLMEQSLPAKDLEIQKHLDNLCNLKQQILKLDPNKESMNDLFSAPQTPIRQQQPHFYSVSGPKEDFKGQRFLFDTESDEANLSSRNILRPLSFSQIDGQHFGSQQGLIFQIESKVKKIYESFEVMVITKEIELEMQQAREDFSIVSAELKMLDGFLHSEKNYQKHINEILRAKLDNLYVYLQDSDCSLLENIQQALLLYYKIRPAIMIEYYQSLLNKLVQVQEQLKRFQQYIKLLDELIEMTEETFAKHLLELTKANIEQKQITDVTVEFKLSIEKIDSKIEESQEKITILCSALIEIFQGNQQNYHDKSNQIDSSLLELTKIQAHLFTTLTPYLTQAYFLIEKLKSLALYPRQGEIIDQLIELNQQVATDLTSLQINATQCINIEEKLLSIQESYYDAEDEKGFLDEKEVKEYYSQILSLMMELSGEFIKKELHLVQLQMNDYNFALPEGIQKFQEILKVAKVLTQQFEIAKNQLIKPIINSIRQRPILVEHEAYQELAINISEFQKLQSPFIVEICKSLNTSMHVTLRNALTERSEEDVLLDDINCLTPILDHLNMTVDFLQPIMISLKDQLGHSASLNESLHTSFERHTIQLCPLILSESTSLFDQLLLDVLNQQLSVLDAKGWHVDFPVFRRLTASHDCAIYELESQTTLDPVAKVKIKVIEVDDKNRYKLCVKQRCGAYLFAERMGEYFSELSLGSKFGFNINTSG